MHLSKPILLFVWFQSALFSKHTFTTAPDDVLSTVKSIVQNIKNGRDTEALSQVDITNMTAFLLEDYKGSWTNTQRTEFTSMFKSYLSKYIFTHLRGNFKDATIIYGAPEISQQKAELISTFTKSNPLKKQDIKVKFSLIKRNTGWRVIDFTYAGDKSLLTNMRDDMIRPALKKGGLEEVLKELRNL